MHQVTTRGSQMRGRVGGHTDFGLEKTEFTRFSFVRSCLRRNRILHQPRLQVLPSVAALHMPTTMVSHPTPPTAPLPPSKIHPLRFRRNKRIRKKQLLAWGRRVRLRRQPAWRGRLDSSQHVLWRGAGRRSRQGPLKDSPPIQRPVQKLTTRKSTSLVAEEAFCFRLLLSLSPLQTSDQAETPGSLLSAEGCA